MLLPGKSSEMMRLVRHDPTNDKLEHRRVDAQVSPQLEVHRAYREGFSLVLTGVERVFEPAFKISSLVSQGLDKLLQALTSNRNRHHLLV